MVDIEAGREAYGKQETSDVSRIRTEDNPANALSKSTPCPALEGLLDTTEFGITVQQWVVHSLLRH